MRTFLVRTFMTGFVLAGPCLRVATATESGASVYPVGAETVLPGLAPDPGTSVLANFDLFYQANALADGQGHSAVSGFHFRLGGVAFKFEHNWGVHVFGGTLISYVAQPILYEHLDGGLGSGNKTGFSNTILEPAAVAYRRGALHWWYGMDFFTPGFSYNKTDLVNIGQHNAAMAPAAAFTYLPTHGTEISSKFQYIVNGQNNQTLYHSGNEFIWEYDVMQNIARKIAVGGNGYYYQQTTNDLQNGVIAGSGNRGRDLAVGPEIRAHVGHLALIAKYQRDTLVRNKAIGNAFWLEMAIPIGRGE